MKNKPESPDSSLSETMAARIEIKELGDPAHQKKITDAVEALDGVIDTKIAKGALHVSYDPLATTEKKIEELSALLGRRSRMRPQILKARIPICQLRMYSKLQPKMRSKASMPDPS